MSLNFELPGHVGTHADGNVLGYYNFWSYCLYIQQRNFLEYWIAIYAYAVLTYTRKLTWLLLFLFMLLNPRLGLTCACNVLYCTMYSVQCTIHLCRVLQSLFFIILLWLIFPALKFSQYLFCRRKKIVYIKRYCSQRVMQKIDYVTYFWILTLIGVAMYFKFQLLFKTIFHDNALR